MVSSLNEIDLSPLGLLSYLVRGNERNGYRSARENFRTIYCQIMLADLYFLGPVHLTYNPSYSACFFSRNSIFLSQKISQ
jgi:hypothetical protein